MSPYCSAVNFKNISNSIFVTLIKEPAGSDVSPYCFYPAYIMIDDNGLEVKTDRASDGFGASLTVDNSGLVEVSAVLRAVSNIGG